MHAFLLSAEFFSKSTFSKKNSMENIRVSSSLDPDDRPNILSGKIWVQAVCKVYPQTILAGKELIQKIHKVANIVNPDWTVV